MTKLSSTVVYDVQKATIGDFPATSLSRPSCACCWGSMLAPLPPKKEKP
jgi:hypothetical protein